MASLPFVLRYRPGNAGGLPSLELQAQAFTIILGAFVFGERLQGKQLAGIALAIFGVLVLVEGSLGGEHVPLVGFMLTLAAALSWACGNIFNKKSCPRRPARQSYRWWWSALIPVLPFMFASWLIDGPQLMLASLRQIDMLTDLVAALPGVYRHLRRLWYLGLAGAL